MIWTINFSDTALKQLKKMDRSTSLRIVKYLKKNIIEDENPCQVGKKLKANLSELWRYRVGDYRIICKIKNKEMIVLVVKLGHRKDIYH